MFWCIKNPEYESDYQASYINGALEHPYSLPGIKCDICGQAWGGSRKLSINCPEPFRQHPNIINPWPIPRHEHIILQRDLMTSLSLNGNPFDELRPGDNFQPCFLDVPSRPRADFLWPSLGSLVVSERIKNLLFEFSSDEITACPVTLRKIGKRESKFPPPMPSTGEPEDIINKVRILNNVSSIGPYFEIIILKDSGYPPGGTPLSICLGCKRADIDDSTRKICMTQDMWKGDNIFFLSTTLHIIVTDEVKKRMERWQPTNVVFEKMRIESH